MGRRIVRGSLVSPHQPRQQIRVSYLTCRAAEGTTIPNKDGTYTWTVGSEHGELPCYGLKIISSDGKYLQYSPPFFIGSQKNCPKTLDGASTAVSSSGASSATSAAPVASDYSVPVVTSAVAPKATGAGVSTHQANVDGLDKNATSIVKPDTAGAGTVAGPGSVSATAGAGPARPSTSLAGRPNNSTGSGVTVQTGAAPLVQAGFLSVLGGVVAVALAL